MAVDQYSRLVTLLKVTLPLIAIALLSTMFLFSRNIDPVSTIPFAENEIRQRLDDQQLTGPVFSGLNETGDEMTVTANTLRNAGEQEQRAEQLKADFELVDGTLVTVTADDGQVNMLAQQAILQGDVHFRTSAGVSLRSERMTARIEPLELISPGPVTGRSPFGALDAGSMRLATIETTGKRHLLFTNGVKVLYQPKSTSD